MPEQNDGNPGDIRITERSEVIQRADILCFCQNQKQNAPLKKALLLLTQLILYDLSYKIQY